MFKQFIKALFGRNQEPAAAGGNGSPPAVIPSSGGEELITVFDAYGREVQITRSDWRDKVFMPNLEKNWNNADQLYSLIVSGLNDGFGSDLLPAAQRLLEIDGNEERSHTVLSIVLMKSNDLDKAEATLRAGMAKVGETGTLLTNLAKVFAERGDQLRADETLWQAVQADPNQENGLLWWASVQRERDGDAGYLQALRTAAALPGSWRAQLWLARHCLGEQDVSAARALYQEVLASGLYDGGALMMMSGDLGNSGQIQLILELIAPAYDERKHDPMAGLNLLRACQQLGKLDEGEALLARMYGLSLAPLKQHLDQFTHHFQEMRKGEVHGTPINEAELKIDTIALNQPIWQYGLSNPDWFFAQKDESAPGIGFFALSKIVDAASTAEEQREDDVGRLTRAIPLYLAEAAHYWSDYTSSCYFQIVEGGGPVVSGAAVDGNPLFDIVPSEMKYFVTGEISGTAEGADAEWRVSLHLWNCSTRTKQATESGAAKQSELGALVLSLEERLLLMVGLAREQAFDEFYLRPTPEVIGLYLTELGQAFMLTLLANNMVPKDRMWGERAMLDWPLNMALQWPGVDVLKVMYISGLGKAVGYQSDVLPEYKERSLQLLRDASAVQSPAARLAPIVWKAFGMSDDLQAHVQSLPHDTHPAYVAWLDRLVGSNKTPPG
ncbi:hypothetical protein WNB94_01975 [Aquabacterium sp. A3]|uniref:tetratricopeptide repeat protein n=1 Tax=Aquabacterium sp. A3 TaxID=3132829 RepID=UPI00311A4B8B